MRRLLPLLFGAVLIPARAPAQSLRPVTSEDYFNFKFVGDPTLSPDGKQLLFTVTRVDRAANRRMTSIWVGPADTGKGAPRQLTAANVSSSAPRWTPDGRAIAFLSSRPVPGDSASARSQLYLLSLEGGEPRRVTSLPNGVSGCELSPDGRRAACLSRTGPGDRKAPSSDVRHYTGLSYKFNDTGWFDDRKSHIWIIDLATGSATQLTSGDAWNDTDPQWSPDGLRIAFVSNRTGNESNGDPNSDVWVVPAAGGQPLRISNHADTDNNPRWSPDGKTIAYLGQERDDDPPMVWLAPSTGGTSTILYQSVDLSPSDLTWAEAGAALYFNAQNHGEVHFFRLDVASRAVQSITRGARAVLRLSLHEASWTIAYLGNDFTHLDEIYVARRDGTGERRVTNVNDACLAGLYMMPVERMTFKGADGWNVDGFLVKPVGWQPGRSYPMVLSIHGGPAGQYGVDWYHEFHVYSAKGWAVFFTNPRGSTGYGHLFQRGIKGEWGGKDYIDIMNGVDAVLAANPWIDRTRLGVTGGSYGGYMTNWIVGHTDRFKAAVTLRSISSFLSDEGTRDGAFGHSSDFGGDLFQRFDLFWDRSPLKYVQNVKTPILVLHSDNDFRVPIEQGEQWFRALRHFGKTAEIVFFPRENHNLTRSGEPRHLVESLDWQVYWFTKYLDGRDDAVPPDRKG